MKIKKQHRKKKYQHKLNRKRMHIKQRSTGEVTWLEFVSFVLLTGVFIFSLFVSFINNILHLQ